MAKAKKTIDQTSQIQKFITEGREVVMKKENETSFVRIRLNNMDVDGIEKWRIFINGNEFRVAEIIINCQTRTLTEKFEEIGIKHHIVCEAKEIIFKNNIVHIN